MWVGWDVGGCVWVGWNVGGCVWVGIFAISEGRCVYGIPFINLIVLNH